MDHGNTFPLMFGIPLMQATQLPHKMMESVHCAPRSTPPHFGVNVMTIIVLSVLTHTLVVTKLFIGIPQITCVVEVKFAALVFCCVLCREGVDSGLLGGLPREG